MLDVRVNIEDGIAMLEPHGPLTRKDFESAAAIIDPYIERAGSLKGVMIHTEMFPGWDSFAALLTHLRFVKDHHRKVTRVAIVTDSALGDFAEKVVSHFVAAEVKHFRFDELTWARNWILNGDGG